MRRLATAAAILAAALLGTPAAAEEAPPPAAWEVLPAPDDDGPRQAFELTLDPGQTHEDTVLVRNRGPEEITVDVWATDAVTTPSGDLGLLLAEDAPRFAGAWITPATARLTLEPGGEGAVPFTVTVPENEQPGDYVAGVVVSMPRGETTSTGERVLVEARVASRVYLRVPGDLAPAVTVSELTLTRDAPWWNFWSGDTRVDFTVTNEGNARLMPQSAVTLSSPFGPLSAAPATVALPELMPGDRLRASALTGVADSLVLPGVPAWGLLSADVSVLARLSTGPDAVRETATVTAVAVPWVPAAVVVLVLARVAFGTVRLVRRRRAARRPVPTTAPAPVEEVVAAPAVGSA
ncbi:DUF916 domain-containing protein [Georgenia satyanarayanai]|uniref:WxL protein peptidoglycan domain-containing protein n=1 Tax=Georgenia satyanarayanai TaxID=860221 RepID=UPI00203F862F|nr:DUF916 domain-containing protein [Georgenia satyanarayanai]MCM3659693.1 DUF916 domain-containing protein [Georgenia satyanarayanai]